MNKTLLQDLGVGLATMVSGVVLWFYAQSIAGTARQLPVIIALAFFLPLGALLVARTIRTHLATKNTQMSLKPARETADTSRPDYRIWSTGALILLAALAIPHVGFLPTVGIFSAAIGLLFGEKPHFAIAYAALLVVAVYGFITAMGINMPSGPLSQFF